MILVYVCLLITGLSLAAAAAPIPCQAPSDCPGDTRCWQCVPRGASGPQGYCEAKPNHVGMACTDHDPFTTYDRCMPTGHCAGIPLECSPCTTDAQCADPDILQRLVNAHNTIVQPPIDAVCAAAICKSFPEGKYVGSCCAIDLVASAAGCAACNCHGQCTSA